MFSFSQCYLYKNATGQSRIISTLLPSSAEGKYQSSTPNVPSVKVFLPDKGTHLAFIVIILVEILVCFLGFVFWSRIISGKITTLKKMQAQNLSFSLLICLHFHRVSRTCLQREINVLFYLFYSKQCDSWPAFVWWFVQVSPMVSQV